MTEVERWIASVLREVALREEEARWDQEDDLAWRLGTRLEGDEDE